MPERTPLLYRPHAIDCIKDSIVALLDEFCKDDLTVACDRTDCWADEELFAHRQAINIAVGADRMEGNVKSSRTGAKLGAPRSATDGACLYDAVLSVDAQVYVEACGDAEECKAARRTARSIAGFVTHVLTSHQSRLLGRRIIYTGSSPQEVSDGELNVAVVTANFQVFYLFDQTRPWVVG